MSEHLFEETSEDDTDIVNDNESDVKEKDKRKPLKLEYWMTEQGINKASHFGEYIVNRVTA